MEQTSSKLTPEKISALRAALPAMPDSQKRKVADLLKRYQTEKVKTRSKDDFLSFIKHVYPGYKVGPHHRKLARIFEEIAAGKKKRVIVNIAPRHGKSEMISYLAPVHRPPQKRRPRRMSAQESSVKSAATRSSTITPQPPVA